MLIILTSRRVIGYFGRSILSGGLAVEQPQLFDVAGVSSDDLFHINIGGRHNDPQIHLDVYHFKAKN